MAQESKVKPQKKLVYPKPIVIDASEKHTATVIWMHGLGDTGKGWYSYMLSFSKSLPYIKFILPTAPKRPITCSNGYVMNGWYDIASLQNRQLNTYDGKDDSMQYIHSLIDIEINTSKISSHRIVIGGFSQGAALSVYSGLLCPHPLAGIICCSGYLLDFKMNNNSMSKLNNRKTMVCMYHAKKDDVVPTAHAKKSYAHLNKNGCNIEWNEYNIGINNGHWVTDKEMLDVLNKVESFLPE
eukprot:88376_1